MTRSDMERLTKRVEGGIQVHYTKYKLPNDIHKSVLGAVVHRLADYEDTGLMTGEIKTALSELERYRELGTVEELDEALYSATL